MADEHTHKRASWVAVVVIILGATALGFALPLHSLVLAIVGGVVLLIGAGIGLASGIMEDAY